VIRYQEVEPDTLIRTAGRDLPTRGRFWIEPATGRVLLTELIAGTQAFDAQIDVSYQLDSIVGLFVPIEMRERYHTGRERSTIDGRATYSNFRQFQVKVDEKFLPIRENPEQR